MTRRRYDDRQQTDDDLQPLGPELPPDVIARRLFRELRGQGIAPPQIRRIALAILCTTEASPKSSNSSSK
jgi:hypothetical protein